MDAVRAGLVGVGWWGGVLFEGTLSASTIAVTTCHSRRDEPRRRFAQTHGIRSADRFEDLLEDPELDALIIATPHSSHADLVVAACDAGKHVFVDKPFVMSMAEGRRCLQAAERSNVTLQVGHQRRRQPANRRIRQMIEDGTLGTVVALEANFSGRGATRDADNWRLDPSERPLAGLTPFGVHAIDTFHSFVGGIRTVWASSTRPAGATRLDDAAILTFEFDSGAVGSLLTSTAVPSVNRIGVLGTDGNAWNHQDGARLLVQSASDRTPREEPTRHLDTIADQMAEFAHCVRTGARPEVDGDAGLRVVAVMEAAIASSSERRPMSVEPI